MKPLIIYAVIVLTLFGGIAVGYHSHLTRNPRKILVALDTSYSMQSAWNDVLPLLGQIRRRRYAGFSLITDKAKIHTWRSDLEPGVLRLYGPRNLVQLRDSRRYPEIAAAHERILITNETSANLNGFDGWRIARP